MLRVRARLSVNPSYRVWHEHASVPLHPSTSLSSPPSSPPSPPSPLPFPLAMLAGQDGLTGLPNRTLLRARLNEGVVQMRRGDTVLAFHCLDLDQFKSVNDNLGHPAGDALLKLVAERLTSILRVGDTVARIGGDEFVVLQAGIHREDEARLLAHQIVRALGAPFVIDGRDVRIGVTVGIALAPQDGVTLDRLAACADAALYQAKHKGRGSVLFAGERPGPSAAATAPKQNRKCRIQRTRARKCHGAFSRQSALDQARRRGRLHNQVLASCGSHIWVGGRRALGTALARCQDVRRVSSPIRCKALPQHGQVWLSMSTTISMRGR